MTELQRIEDQLRRAMERDAWHGPPLREILDGVTAEQAAQRPLPSAHSIWEIVLHIGVWQSVVHRRLNDEVIVDLPPEKDWPTPRDLSEAAWQSAVQEMVHESRNLRQAILGLREEKLGETVPGMDYSVYVMLHGVVQHTLYHAGQIALLKKAL